LLQSSLIQLKIVVLYQLKLQLGDLEMGDVVTIKPYEGKIITGMGEGCKGEFKR